MATQRTRRAPQALKGTVVRTERLTPSMYRIVLGGPGLKEFSAGEWTDHYIKLFFPRPGVSYPEPFDMQRIREEFPREQWPVSRTYTVRRWDADAGELTVDFVVHGTEGVAGPWAAAARPGDVIDFAGPGGAYAPAPDADWHLLAGDEAALPAIAAALEGMPDGAVVRAFVEVAGPEEEHPGVGPVEWVHRGGRRVGEALVEAVRSMDLPDGVPHAFVHGEAGFVKDLRRWLRVDQAVPRERLSVSGYWRLGHDEDGWQASKTEWNAEVEAEQEKTA
ncbi:siderophore-interacting protein [Actinocorallia aurantiaca]|uniref:Siderophore-interacting protein n=1 Tax=Actinocorallia aurantiaca TaxID=46204 RepID=A0ABN3U569_9ACTN